MTSTRMSSNGVRIAMGLSVALAIWELVTMPLRAQFAGGTILGRVSDPDGRPVRVKIMLQEATRQEVATTLSDATTGNFAFPSLRYAAYHLVVDTEPYRPFDTEVVLRPIFQPLARVDITLEYRLKNVVTTPPGISGSESRTVRMEDLQAQLPKKTLKAYEKGNRARSRGDFDMAIQYYEQALRSSPDFEPALTNLGGVWLRQRRLVDAQRVFEKAYALDSTSAENCINLGHVYIELDRLAEAEQLLLRAVQSAPQSALAHFLLGTALAARGADQEAENRLLRAVELDPAGTTAAHLALANLYLKDRRWEEACTSLQAYLRARPDDPQAAAIRETIRRLQSRQGSQP
jgi:Flp pilus assembly protein TadD